MSGQTYQTPAVTETPGQTGGVAPQNQGPDNSAVLAQTGLGGAVSTVENWATEAWDWLWGNDPAPQQGPAQLRERLRLNNAVYRTFVESV